ncbi:transcriptional regulator, TetR family [Hydrocarboniphaga daqingensis]|jgi:AcrR family transcriptional regulator|uniref:Transcriptional regulator, TetR family n=1 Tax=Hydrocarboniphaga daqingensis TaxID=490188 RepID=A0A1M5M3H0_9GAMM|nr:TetR/AcrR family transcriptional regulator [Hydrocarboniphaga daqingensis]SHG71449.1 transcriptional regulator, TetR family [Hydrocarboniphaga daqingensis]
MVDSAKTPGRSYRGATADERRDERKRKLIEAGIKVIGRDGYASTTVRAVCAEAGLTERYFYEAIGDREQLLGEVYGHLVTQLRAQIAETVMTAGDLNAAALARLGLTGYFAAMRDNPDAARILLFEVLGVSPEVTRLSQRAIADFAMLIRMTARRLPQLPVPEQQEDLITAGLVGSVVFIAMTWFLEGYQRDLDDVVGSAMTIFNAVVDTVDH